jgi:ParB/RepB/Spo0J family partition protein
MKDEEGFREIPLADIVPSPANPRTGKDRDIESLTESIKEKGVLEPIIVRPVQTQSHPRVYEIVAGERRWIAAKRAGLKTIPAIVKEMDADEAYDVMIIENLQRDDLTEMEEALSFKAYLDKHGKESAVSIAQRTSISAAYVRRRVAVLGLPGYATEAWKKGQLLFGHLEQLLRIKDEKTRKDLFDRTRGTKENSPSTVANLRENIDRMAPDLKTAFFALDSAGCLCLSCGSNSAIQNELFAIDADAKVKMKCLDKKCFVGKQRKFLTDHWAESSLAKRFKTMGFRTIQQVGWSGFEGFRDWGQKPQARCFKCEHFVTIVDEDFEVRGGQACLNKNCHRALGRAKTPGEKKKIDPNMPRVAWHGEYFRDVFLTKRIPEVVKTLEPDGLKARTLLLALAIKENAEARTIVGKKLGLKDLYPAQAEVFEKLFSLPYSKAKAAMLAAVNEILLQGQHRGNYGGFGTLNRFVVSKYLGIDLAKEFAVDEEYLKRKTKLEIQTFIARSGLIKEPKFIAYLEKALKGKKPITTDKMKKSEVVEAVLKCAVNLVGLVPDEILKARVSWQ